MQCRQGFIHHGHNMIQAATDHMIALAIVGAIAIPFSITADGQQQEFVGAAGKQLKYIVIVPVFSPMPAGGATMGDLVSAETLEFFTIFLPEKVIGQFDNFRHE